MHEVVPSAVRAAVRMLTRGNTVPGKVLLRVQKPTDSQVLSTLKLLCPATTRDEFKLFPYEEKLKIIKQLLERGASIRQLEKLTGIGRGVIQFLFLDNVCY